MNYRTIFTVGACLLAATIARGELAKTITTTDGQVYDGVSLIRIEPDGYLINYQPMPNSMGIAKIKFSRLSKDLQRQAGYNASEAREFEMAVADAGQEYARTISQWNAAAQAARDARETWQMESAARLKMENAQKYRAQENSAPASVTSYATPGWVYYGGGLFLVPVPQMGNSGKIDNTRVKIFTDQSKMPPRKPGKYTF